MVNTALIFFLMKLTIWTSTLNLKQKPWKSLILDIYYKVYIIICFNPCFYIIFWSKLQQENGMRGKFRAVKGSICLSPFYSFCPYLPVPWISLGCLTDGSRTLQFFLQLFLLLMLFLLLLVVLLLSRTLPPPLASISVSNYTQLKSVTNLVFNQIHGSFTILAILFACYVIQHFLRMFFFL